MKKIAVLLMLIMVLSGCGSQKGGNMENQEIHKIDLISAPVLDKNKIESHSAISLWPENNIPYNRHDSNHKATVQAFLAPESDEAVIIFPGGGYFLLSSEGEGVNVAKAYNKRGVSAFVVCYRYEPYDGKAILADAHRAVQWVRFYADEFGINPQKLALCGFSAGGHLSVVTAQHEPEENLVKDEIGEVSAKVNACILAYPVVTLGDGTYPTMPKIFLGENKNNKDEIEKYSYNYNLKAMPATFVFASILDDAVDYKKNAKAIASALEKIKTPVEYHEYPDGAHGAALGTNTKEYVKWLDQSVDFLKETAGF